MDKEKLERINARMNIAKDKLVVAADLIAAGHYDDAVSRAYYAMFYASKALLLAVGEDPYKHSGVVALFGSRIVKLGFTDRKYGRMLAQAQRLREDADYNEFRHMSNSDATEALSRARDFVTETGSALQRLLESRKEKNATYPST